MNCDQIVLLGVRRHRRQLAGFLLGDGEIALVDLDAVDLGDHRVLVLRGNRSGGRRARAPARRRERRRGAAGQGDPAGNRNVMMLSLETWPAPCGSRGVLVTQQPWHCNGRAAPVGLNVHVSRARLTPAAPPIDNNPTPSYLSNTLAGAQRISRRFRPKSAAFRSAGSLNPAAARVLRRPASNQELPVMIGAVARKLFGSANERRIRSYQPRVAAINALEAGARRAVRRGAESAHRRLQEADRRRRPSSTISWCPPSPPCAKPPSARIGQRHFDVQLIGGMILHEGKISEMKTGEGKTLVATLPVYLNALTGRGVHVVTVNDYLAKRDAEWMGQIYNFLGLTVGVIVHGLDDEERKKALRLRRHLRHQQRARLRLPARQHEVPHGGHGPARPRLRHRRRSRLDPDRRGAHAADHLRPARRPLRILQHHRQPTSPRSTRATTRSTRSSAPSP